MNNTTIQLSKGIENMFVVRCKRDKAISNYLVYNLLILMKNILIQLSLIHKKSAEREIIGITAGQQIHKLLA